MARIGAPYLHTLFIISSFLVFSQIHARSFERRKLERAPITVEGLSYDYYSESCPSVETIARKYLEQVFAEDSATSPSILRLFFHDCYTSGCDASILIDPANGELSVRLQNAGFKDEAIHAIENLRALIHKQCQRVVSCSDIITIAAREAVFQFGGPDFDVPLGRKDSLTFNLSSPLTVPNAFDKTGVLLEAFGKKNFDATDLVALSGAHTHGEGHCGALQNRTIDEQPPMDPELKRRLVRRCPNTMTGDTPIYLDIRTPKKFDNLYYVNLLNNQGVLTSDQDLASDPRTKDIVKLFASDEKLFFEKFAIGFVKMSQLDVLTGNDGEIRKSCFATNNEVSSMAEEVVELVENI